MGRVYSKVYFIISKIHPSRKRFLQIYALFPILFLQLRTYGLSGSGKRKKNGRGALFPLAPDGFSVLHFFCFLMGISFVKQVKQPHD